MRGRRTRVTSVTVSGRTVSDSTLTDSSVATPVSAAGTVLLLTAAAVTSSMAVWSVYPGWWRGNSLGSSHSSLMSEGYIPGYGPPSTCYTMFSCGVRLWERRLEAGGRHARSGSRSGVIPRWFVTNSQNATIRVGGQVCICSTRIWPGRVDTNVTLSHEVCPISSMKPHDHVPR